MNSDPRAEDIVLSPDARPIILELVAGFVQVPCRRTPEHGLGVPVLLC